MYGGGVFHYLLTVQLDVSGAVYGVDGRDSLSIVTI